MGGVDSQHIARKAGGYVRIPVSNTSAIYCKAASGTVALYYQVRNSTCCLSSLAGYPERLALRPHYPIGPTQAGKGRELTVYSVSTLPPNWGQFSPPDARARHGNAR